MPDRYYNVPGQPDRGDRRKHECGCVTHFDVALWRSFAEVRCPEHTRASQRPIGAPMSDEVDRPPCPECRAGKHPNCDGVTWDLVIDEPVPCPCDARNHQ